MKKYTYLDMVKTLLPEEEFLEFKQRYDKPIRKSIKILKSKGEFAVIKEKLSKEGRKLEAPTLSRKGKVYDDVLFVEKQDKQSLGSHLLHQEGKFYVQEMSAGMPAQLLLAHPWEIVLDMCAAPGGKSIQVADTLWNGLLISNELNPARRKALEANLERCGIWNVLVIGYDGRKLGSLLSEQCDKVLLDAPCSGEGMQYKSDFKIYQWNEKAVRKLAHLQRELLISGLSALKIGGELVYSTCTTNVIENEMVVASVLEALGENVELVNVEIEEKSFGISPEICRDRACPVRTKVARFRPHLHHTGGFFIAKFRKKSKITEDFNRITEDFVWGWWKISEELQDKVWEYLQREFWVEKEEFPDMLFVQTKFSIRAVSRKGTELLNQIFIERCGLPIVKVLNDGKWKVLNGAEKIFGKGV